MTGTLEAAPSLDWSAFAPSCRLGDTDWQVWGIGLLRSAGFPVSGLDRFGGQRAMRAAAFLQSGAVGHDEFVAAYEADRAAESDQLARVAADERVRLAIAWQNRTMYRILDSVASSKGTGAKRRERERTLAMYWLRYCAKAETIGFFGPAAWISVGQVQRAVEFRPGPSLIADSRVFFEHWMIAALGDWMAGQPGARWWFPPMLRADVHLDGDRLVMPGRRLVRLGEDDLHVLRHTDGDRNGESIADALIAEQRCDGTTARQRVEQVLLRLLRQRVVSWDANIPVGVHAEEILRRRVTAVGDAELFVRFDAVLAELGQLRKEVDRADSAEELTAALDRLDEFFVRTTGQSPSREHGKAYAGRTLCYQDTLRDCRMHLGRDFLDGVSRPLALMADSADWFGDRLARLAEAEVARMVRDIAARHGKVTFADIWPKVLRLYWGDDACCVRTATRELAQKWREVIGFDPDAAPSARLHRSVAEIEDRARALFATGGSCSPHLALHSPDLQVVAPSVDAVNAGDYTVVLGELHACLATLDLSFLDWTTDGESLRDKINTAVGAERMVPLLPVGWRRNSGRMVPAPIGTGDRLIGFTRAPFGDRARIDPAAAIVLADADGTVTATTPDGRSWPVRKLLEVLTSIIAADAFKIGLDGAHSPRVTLDDLVVFRETWRMPVGGLELPSKADRHRDYLAVRRWVAENTLPDRAYVKFPQETKPSLFDFTSPTLVLSFANLVRRGRRLDPDAVMTLSEPLPAPGDSWLPDADGQRYVSELRLQISRKATE